MHFNDVNRPPPPSYLLYTHFYLLKEKDRQESLLHCLPPFLATIGQSGQKVQAVLQALSHGQRGL